MDEKLKKTLLRMAVGALAPVLEELQSIPKLQAEIAFGILAPISGRLRRLCEEHEESQEGEQGETQLRDSVITFKMTEAYPEHAKDCLWAAWSTFFRKSVTGRTRQEAVDSLLTKGPAILIENLDANEPVVVLETGVRICRNGPGLRLVGSN